MKPILLFLSLALLASCRPPDRRAAVSRGDAVSGVESTVNVAVLVDTQNPRPEAHYHAGKVLREIFDRLPSKGCADLLYDGAGTAPLEAAKVRKAKGRLREYLQPTAGRGNDPARAAERALVTLLASNRARLRRLLFLYIGSGLADGGLGNRPISSLRFPRGFERIEMVFLNLDPEEAYRLRARQLGERARIFTFDARPDASDLADDLGL